MVAFANALAERRIDIVTFSTFCTASSASRIPDPNARLESCWRAVIETSEAGSPQAPISWRSAASRWAGVYASQVAAGGAGDLAGLVFLGYPLPSRARQAGPAARSAPARCEGSYAVCARPCSARPPSCRPSSASSRARGSVRRRRRRPFVQGSKEHRGLATGRVSRHPGSDSNSSLKIEDQARRGRQQHRATGLPDLRLESQMEGFPEYVTADGATGRPSR